MCIEHRLGNEISNEITTEECSTLTYDSMRCRAGSIKSKLSLCRCHFKLARSRGGWKPTIFLAACPAWWQGRTPTKLPANSVLSYDQRRESQGHDHCSDGISHIHIWLQGFLSNMNAFIPGVGCPLKYKTVVSLSNGNCSYVGMTFSLYWNGQRSCDS